MRRQITREAKQWAYNSGINYAKIGHFRISPFYESDAEDAYFFLGFDGKPINTLEPELFKAESENISAPVAGETPQEAVPTEPQLVDTQQDTATATPVTVDEPATP